MSKWRWVRILIIDSYDYAENHCWLHKNLSLFETYQLSTITPHKSNNSWIDYENKNIPTKLVWFAMITVFIMYDIRPLLVCFQNVFILCSSTKIKNIS